MFYNVKKIIMALNTILLSPVLFNTIAWITTIVMTV